MTVHPHANRASSWCETIINKFAWSTFRIKVDCITTYWHNIVNYNTCGHVIQNIGISSKMICLHRRKCVTFVLYRFSGTLSAWVCLAVIAKTNHEIDGNWQFFTPCIKKYKFVFGTSWLHLCLVCYAYSMVHCKVFGLLQPYFGCLSCMPVVYVIIHYKLQERLPTSSWILMHSWEASPFVNLPGSTPFRRHI